MKKFMTKIKLYLNENIQTAVVEALRKRGIDTISTMEANRKAFSDEEQLKFAKKEGKREKRNAGGRKQEA